MKTSLVAVSSLLFSLVMSFSVQANVIVSFEARVANFTPGPLQAGSTFTGSFELDSSVSPTSGPNRYFNNALDDFAVTINNQSFGGTDGRHLQLTGPGGTSGYMLGTLNDGTNGATTYGSYFDGVEDWLFTGLRYDFRGLADTFFVDGDSQNLAHDLTRDASGSDISYAIMDLYFANSAGDKNNSLRIGFNYLDFSGIRIEPVSEPSSLLLFALGLLALRRSRKV